MATTWTPWNISSLILFFFMMVGFGCSLHLDKFQEHIKKPKGIAIGFLSQFLVMPFVCYSLAEISKLDAHLQVALILIGCCPGGALSNMCCYIFRMDIELSVAMTTCSSLAAIFMMPLNTFIYIKVVDNTKFTFDWIGLIVSCLVVVFGTLFGLFLNYKYYQHSLKVEKVGRITMIIIIIGSFVSNATSGVPLWKYEPRYIYAIILAPAAIGGLLGLSASLILRLPKPSCIAVANETGFQNVVLAMAIITLTYKFSFVCLD